MLLRSCLCECKGNLPQLVYFCSPLCHSCPQCTLNYCTKLLNQTGIFHSVVAMCNDIIPRFFWRNNLILILFLSHCIL